MIKKIDDAPRLLQPGEVGFAGKTVQECPAHGPVLWCICMRTPEEQAEMDRRERAFLNVVRALLEKKEEL